jgi:LIVCS family branched-chain amino acid:cation transporter
MLAHVFSVGLAIFAMLFGAGNVVFPLGLGRDTGTQVLFAILGLVLSGVAVPLLGLVSSSLFDGDYKKFLGMAGRIPGAFLALVCMLLIGPFGATPRCITLAYAAVHWHIPSLSLIFFSLVVAGIVFVATIKRRFVVDLMGRILGPIKLTLLLSIIVLGLFATSQPQASLLSGIDAFYKGLKEGYWTLDLLATIFFSGLIISSIKARSTKEKPLSSQQVAMFGLKAGVIGGLLLGAVYTGFCLLAAKFGAQVAGVPKDQLLSALAMVVMGPKACLLANATMAMACLTTAIALTAVFADYLRHELFFGRIKYHYALLLTVTATFAMTNLGFAGIATVIEPVAVVCYPALIVLSLANAAHALWGFNYVKPVVLLTFVGTLVSNFWPF